MHLVANRVVGSFGLDRLAERPDQATVLQFLRATASLDASNGWLIRKTILPMIWPVLIVQVTLDAGFAMLASAALSLLGPGAA